jgi:chromosome segregation ATPase
LASLTVDPKEQEITEAKIAVKRRQREEALASGDQELAAKVEKEIGGISGELQPHSEEIQSLNIERDEIQRQIDQAGGQTLSLIFPKIRDYCHGEWAKALEATEEGWGALQQFQSETGVRLSDTIHRNGLTPQSISANKELQIRFEKWIF